MVDDFRLPACAECRKMKDRKEIDSAINALLKRNKGNLKIVLHYSLVKSRCFHLYVVRSFKGYGDLLEEWILTDGEIKEEVKEGIGPIEICCVNDAAVTLYYREFILKTGDEKEGKGDEEKDGKEDNTLHIISDDINLLTELLNKYLDYVVYVDYMPL